jgi:hypothetical protein
MLQIMNLIGEIVDKNEKGNVVVNVHTFYVTSSDTVIRDAFVTVHPSKYVRGPAFDRLEAGNLVFFSGQLDSNEYGNPYVRLLPDGGSEAVFGLTADNVQLLAESADEKRGSDLFEIILIGNLGRDAETRYTQGGKEFSTASIATNYKSGDVDKTTWFKITSWVSSMLGSMTKGMKVFLVGVPRFDEKTGGPLTWVTNAGETRSNFEINVQRLIPLQKVEQSVNPVYDDDDPLDIPF